MPGRQQCLGSYNHLSEQEASKRRLFTLCKNGGIWSFFWSQSGLTGTLLYSQKYIAHCYCNYIFMRKGNSKSIAKQKLDWMNWKWGLHIQNSIMWILKQGEKNLKKSQMFLMWEPACQPAVSAVGHSCSSTSDAAAGGVERPPGWCWELGGPSSDWALQSETDHTAQSMHGADLAE